jgi:hypothetical protein
LRHIKKKTGIEVLRKFENSTEIFDNDEDTNDLNETFQLNVDCTGLHYKMEKLDGKIGKFLSC